MGMALILPCLDYYVVVYTQVSAGYSSVISLFCSVLVIVIFLRVLFSVPVLLVWSVTYHPTSDSGNKYYVCTLTTSPRINRLVYLDHHAHAP